MDELWEQKVRNNVEWVMKQPCEQEMKDSWSRR
jgi:hypothetical protein